MRQLYQHQIEAVKQLKSNKRFLLAHSCGTGKSLSALTAAKELNKPVIIVSPESAKVTWKQENEDVEANIVEMYNYSSFKKLKNKDIKDKILIMDESHHLSHIDSDRTKQALSLTDYERLFLLSGTCVPDRPIDLYSILLLLGLREQSKRDFYAFRSKYAILKKKMIGWRRLGSRRVPRYIQEIVGWKNLDILRKEIAPKSSFLKLEEITDMPPAQFIPITFELTPEEQRRRYSIASEGHLMDELQFCSNASAKRVGDILDQIGKDKVVCFSGFLSTIEALVKEFDGVELIGETKDREQALESFRGDKDLLCTTFHTGSESLNLQNARYTIFTDLPHYLLQFRQALSRTYRIGQKGSVVYYFLIPSGTIIEKVFKVLQDKFDIVKNVFIQEDLDIMNLMGELR